MNSLTIGQLAKASGINAKMIRYYESIALIPEAQRSEGNYRLYQESDIHRLRFIQRARKLGFGIDQIRMLMALWQDQQRSSAEVKALALTHVGELKARITEMQSMVNALEDLACKCHGDDRPDCPILENLTGH
jgi:MerR family transcriptional regulator, copper efflux regulator